MSATQTLIDLYERSTPTVRRRGRSWYPEAKRLLERLAADYERPVAQTVAVFAITSANTQLLSNFRFTEKVLRGERKSGCYPTHQEPLIEAVFTTRYPGRFVRGPKCSAFYRAIMGDTEALVLDRWAARAAGVKVRRDLNKTVRRELDAAYREAARLCGESVRAFQAIVWIVIRESTPNTKAVIPRYFDITKGGVMQKNERIKERLEYLRGELRGERISWGDLAELQSLADHIDPGDVELLEAAGVPEFETPDEQT